MKCRTDSFSHDKSATTLAYLKSEYKIANPIIRDHWLPIIIDILECKKIDFGINFEKPWEEIEMDDYFQLEYLFIGEIKNQENLHIEDQVIGINIFKQSHFGNKEFGTDHILNLTLIINK